MVYEIYAQSNNQGWIAKTAKKRYFTKNKGKAFNFADYMNKHETEKQEWRVAKRVTNRIIFDIDDSKDIENVRNIIKYYNFISSFDVFKTNGGFHLHSKKTYINEWDWHYDCCRVLFPILETSQIISYLGKLNDWYNKKLKEEFELGWNRIDYIENIKETFPSSGLYCGYGEFDIVFALMVIFKGYYCIRISKKNKDDKIELIQL